jgi:hypothetical protein
MPTSTKLLKQQELYDFRGLGLHPLIGPTLRARTLPVQKSEARMACAVINRMTQLGMSISQRVR